MTTKLWKRNAVVAVVLLFICVGVYLNWSYDQTAAADTAETAVDTVELMDTVDTAVLEETAQELGTEVSGGVESVDALTDDLLVVSDGGDYGALLTQTDTDTAMADYFAAIRLARQESRDNAVDVLQETIAYETGADDGAASAASGQLEELVSTALKEAEIEGLVIAKGYEDCVTYMSDGAISVAVAAPAEGLTAEAVAQICDIVTTQSDYTPSELKIIEVK